LPELPEVELYRRYFAAHALRRRIVRVVVRDERILGAVTPAKLRKELVGRPFAEVRRHGKHLFADAGHTWLHLHFGMTGEIAYYGAAAQEPRFARLVIDFMDGAHLAFVDMRLFGAVDLTPSPHGYIAAHRLGPDALDPKLRAFEFRRRLETRRGAIKAVILSQEVIAGPGNLYTDEALFHTSIDPRRPALSLSASEARSLFSAMRQILKTAIDRKSAGLGYPARYLAHHREEGGRCPRCGDEIRRTVVGGRTTYYCGKHQR
jgi:formamidopyrimidine-DNA glycosylase